MRTGSPAVIIYDANGVPLGVYDNTAIPANTPAVLLAGTDGVNSRYALLDSSGRPIVKVKQVEDISANGTITALNGIVSILPVGCSGSNFSITGTWVGTLTFEATIDSTNWFSVTSLNQSTAAFVPSTTVNGNFRLNVASYAGFRIRASAWTSGTATVYIVAGLGATDLSYVSGGSVASDIQGMFVTGSVASPKPVVIGGKYPTDGTLKYIAIDSEGRIITSPPGTIATQAGFKMGYINTSALGNYAVRATTYTEPTANGQRSIASANAADTAAGTGMRTVVLTYFDQTGAGPFTETLTLNGTTGVNTVATDICFIESIRGVTVGSGGTNAGIITLYTQINKGGTAIGTIAVGDGRTYWSHHYVGTTVTCYITSCSVGHNGTVVGSGGVFVLRSVSIPSANKYDEQISDFIRLYGQASTFARNYGTAIKVAGPARVVTWLSPESTSSIIYRAAFDYYDQPN